MLFPASELGILVLAMVSWLTQIFRDIWASGHVPDDFGKEIILPFYKGKGSRQI